MEGIPNIFEKKETRADIRYQPESKDLKLVTHFGDLSNEEERKLLIGILNNYQYE